MPGFGDWVEQRRIFLEMNRQIDLARAARLSISVISGIESTGSLKKRSQNTQQKLADALQVTLEELQSRAAGKPHHTPVRERPKRTDDGPSLIDRATMLVGELSTIIAQLRSGDGETIQLMTKPVSSPIDLEELSKPRSGQ